MAEQGDNDDRTEEATPERREDFRKKGQVAVSREVTSVFVLAGVVITMSFYLGILIEDLTRFMKFSFQRLHLVNIEEQGFKIHLGQLLDEVSNYGLAFICCKRCHSDICYFLTDNFKLFVAEIEARL